MTALGGRPIEIAVMSCPACGRLDPGPRQLCPECQAPLVPATAEALGTIVSWTVIRRPPAAFREDVAYAVAVVRLDAGVQVTGRLATPGEDAPPGTRVAARSLVRTAPLFEIVR